MARTVTGSRSRFPARETTAEGHHVGVEDVQRGRDELADDLGRSVSHPDRTRVSRPLGMH